MRRRVNFFGCVTCEIPNMSIILTESTPSIPAVTNHTLPPLAKHLTLRAMGSVPR
jgi:hypothetical protein